MERVVYWNLENTTLKTSPLHKNQHAFRRGHSTEIALVHLVNKIEKAILRNEFALGVFLDIEGAFDNLSIEAAICGMKSHNFPQCVTYWYAYYLRNRICKVDINSTLAERLLTKYASRQSCRL